MLFIYQPISHFTQTPLHVHVPRRSLQQYQNKMIPQPSFFILKKLLLYSFFSNISRPKSMKEHSAFIYRLNEFLIKSQSYNIRATSNVTFNIQKTACSIQFHFAILSSIKRCLNACFIESAVLFIS